MSQGPILTRWRSALTLAATRTLRARWRSTLDALEEARMEYGALRKAARRVHDLEQLCGVLTRELQVSR